MGNISAEASSATLMIDLIISLDGYASAEGMQYLLGSGDALIRQRVQAALGYDDTATDVSLSHVRP